jgi:predicted DNA binding protein
VTTHPDHTVAVVGLPDPGEVRTFVDRLEERYPGTELVSRRERTEHDGTDLHRVLDSGLTDRQREVLATAYESGFFESPRETTGVELAELLGVSQPTVTHHLREGQRRLFAALFDDA